MKNGRYKSEEIIHLEMLLLDLLFWETKEITP
jgi:hypothetical protein